MNKHKSCWNYRIIKTHWKLKDMEGDSYAIHEVYYESEKPTSWTADAIAVVGESPEDIKNVLVMMAEAYGKPILTIEGDKLVEVNCKLIVN